MDAIAKKITTKNGRCFKIVADLGDRWLVKALGMVGPVEMPKASEWIEKVVTVKPGEVV